MEAKVYRIHVKTYDTDFDICIEKSEYIILEMFDGSLRFANPILHGLLEIRYYMGGSKQSPLLKSIKMIQSW